MKTVCVVLYAGAEGSLTASQLQVPKFDTGVGLLSVSCFACFIEHVVQGLSLRSSFLTPSKTCKEMGWLLAIAPRCLMLHSAKARNPEWPKKIPCSTLKTFLNPEYKI